MIDFRGQLRKQLGFVERSCAAFDAGHEDEAIRIATCIRILVHHTKSSTSLLSHMGNKNVKLLSTVRSLDLSRNVRGFDGLTTFSAAGPFAGLGGSGFKHNELKAPVWWNQPVYVSGKTIYHRSDLVLSAANKDGGAHVDANLTPEYENLMHNFWIEVRFTSGGQPDASPLTNIHLIGLRQLGYEILNSPALTSLAK